jgi:hypothetical protein
VKNATIGLSLIAALVLTVVLLGPFLIYPVATPVLAPLLPRPPGVPGGATAEYGFKGGVTWRWERKLPGGCVGWMAVGSWADVFVSADGSRCRDGPGAAYFSSGDSLDFRGYWQKPNQGGGQPCPETLTPAQIEQLRQVTRRAVAASVTAPEKAILRRIDERLARVDGQALTTDASGWCNDLKPEDYSRPRPRPPELWPSS